MKGAKADLAHNIVRVSIICLEAISAILAVTVGLDDEYQDAGVYNGTIHGVERALCFSIFTGLGFVTIKLGNDFSKKLAGGGKVAPSGNDNADKKAEKKSEEKGKILLMVSRLKIVLVIVNMYFIYDVMTSIGKVSGSSDL